MDNQSLQKMIEAQSGAVLAQTNLNIALMKNDDPAILKYSEEVEYYKIITEGLKNG